MTTAVQPLDFGTGTPPADPAAPSWLEAVRGREAGYRRLRLAILGLDWETLGADLQRKRLEAATAPHRRR
jgi:hypothetical protein